MAAYQPSSKRVMADFRLIEGAAIKGERCPQNQPHGPVAAASMAILRDEGFIRVETYRWNYRVAVILKGDHAGLATKPPPDGGKPWLIDGRRADGTRLSMHEPRPKPLEGPLKVHISKTPWKPGDPIPPGSKL
jgi:hypothetical protein